MNKKVEIAGILDMAAYKSKAVSQVRDKYGVSLEEAYKIQEESIKRRFIRGEKLLGYKMGFTSRAKMEQMGVDDLIWGRLTDSMFVKNGGSISLSNFIHPRCEPEIAFRISRTIDRALSLSEVKNYVDGLCPAIEVIDSRFENFKFTLEDVVADNCSSSAFALGAWESVDTDISDLKMDLIVDGEAVQSGTSKAILDNPWESLVEASRLITAYGAQINIGEVVLAGAATPAVFVKEGQMVKATVENMSTVILDVKK